MRLNPCREKAAASCRQLQFAAVRGSRLRALNAISSTISRLSLSMGIGAMTARVQDFYDKMVKAGVVKVGLDVKKAYTLEFVDHGVGADPQPK